MYGCESWTLKKAERSRIHASEVWCWRRLLRVLWTARKSNQLILKEINPEYSLEGLMLKLKLQYFGHLMQSWLIGKDLGARKDWRWEEKRAPEDEMFGWHHRFKRHAFEQAPGDGEGQGILVCLSPWYHKESDIMSSDWTTSSVPNYHSIRVIHLETSLFFLTKYERMVGMSSGNKFSKSLLHRNLHVKDFG